MRLYSYLYQNLKLLVYAFWVNFFAILFRTPLMYEGAPSSANSLANSTASFIEMAGGSLAYFISYTLTLNIEIVTFDKRLIFQPFKLSEIVLSISAIFAEIPRNTVFTLSSSSSSQIKLSYARI